MTTHFLDRIRVGLTVLVILHHSAITYGASGGWFFRSDVPESDALTLFAAVNQSFFLGFFFLIAGYFTPASLARKGCAIFLRERLLRLGVPLVLFGFLIGPLTVAIAETGRDPLIRWYEAFRFGAFVPGPLWFNMALLGFAGVYALVAAVVPARETPARPVPGPLAWGAAIMICGVAALLLRQLVPVGQEVMHLQIGYFASYVLLFALGCAASRHRWLERIGRREALPWMIVSALVLPVLPMVLLLLPEARGVETGFGAAATTYAFWEPIIAAGTVAGCLWLVRVHGNAPRQAWIALAANSYGAFVLHAPIIVTLAVLLEPVQAAPLLKSAAVGGLGCILGFSAAALLRHRPFMRRII